MNQLSAVLERPSPLRLAVASDIVAATKQALAAFGELPPSRRNELVAQLAPGTAALHRSGMSATDAAKAELKAQVERWLAAVFAAEAPSAAAFRSAFLEIDGARRWPGQLLGSAVEPAFMTSLVDALPRALPAEAPLEMPDQSF